MENRRSPGRCLSPGRWWLGVRPGQTSNACGARGAEYRHDRANQKVFAIRAPGYVPTGKSQDTISFDLYSLFF